MVAAKRQLTRFWNCKNMDGKCNIPHTLWQVLESLLYVVDNDLSLYPSIHTYICTHLLLSIRVKHLYYNVKNVEQNINK
jgi:hypothetical protein